MTRLLPLLLALTACGPVPVRLLDLRQGPGILGEDAEPFDRIEIACEHWGVDCVETGEGEGSLGVMLSNGDGHLVGDEHDRVGGVSWGGSRCTLVVWAMDDDECPWCLEHELGHAFSRALGDAFQLQDIDAPGFVMHGIVQGAGPETTDRQRRRVQQGADAIAGCPGGNP